MKCGINFKKYVIRKLKVLKQFIKEKHCFTNLKTKLPSMSSKKSAKPFGFGFSQSGSASRTKSVLESADQRQKPPSLDYFSDEETQPKKRKLIKLDDPLEEQSATSSTNLDSYDLKEDYVGNLEDERVPPSRTSTGLISCRIYLMCSIKIIYDNLLLHI